MKRSIQAFVAMTALAGIAALSGCASDCDKCETKSGTATAAIVNKTCPVGGDEVANDTLYRTSFQGKEVGFCCESCTKAWAKMSDTDRQAKLASVMKK